VVARSKKSKNPIKQAQDAGARPTTSRSSKQLWKVFSKATTVLSGVVTLRLTQSLWQAATHKKPPNSPEHPDIDAREAILWAVLAGVSAELVKVVLSRKAAQYWVRSTGNLLPDMDPIDD